MDLFGKKREQTQRDLIIAYKRAFGTPEGKRVLFDLMDRYHMLNHHKGDAFKEGQRSVILDIFKATNIDLVKFDELLKENSKDGTIGWTTNSG